ncbi:MAG: hypothetical protein NTW74_03185 [Acidobacteria bacterium]|nr:hypothetical protein [Acidobacteriota bacterium]
MRVFLVFALCFTTWAQETSGEYKLPENFLRFNVSKIYAAVSNAPKSQPPVIVEAAPKEISCGHIRILPANPDLDPGMTLPKGAYIQSRMPVLKGMPACQTTGR